MKKDSEETIKRGNEKIIEKFLPILEDLERAVEIGRNSGENNKLQEGVEMILKEVNQILQEEGLKRLDPVGKSFNPDHHEAVGKVATDKYPEDTVVKELRKGYLLNGRVIRTSMVEVAKKGG